MLKSDICRHLIDCHYERPDFDIALRSILVYICVCSAEEGDEFCVYLPFDCLRGGATGTSGAAAVADAGAADLAVDSVGGGADA